MIAVLTAAGGASACGTNDGREPSRSSTSTVQRESLPATTDSAGGEVVGEVMVVADSSAAPVGRWISDENTLAFMRMLNTRQIAAADIELENWHSDSVRAFALTIARDHAALQHSVDSVAELVHLAPIRSALVQQVSAALQTQIDSLARSRDGAFDRAFVHQQAASQAVVGDYAQRLSAVTARPELLALLATAATQAAAHAAHARALEAKLLARDSIAARAAADSAAKRAARIKRD
jgi:putative membrane protein